MTLQNRAAWQDGAEQPHHCPRGFDGVTPGQLEDDCNKPPHAYACGAAEKYWASSLCVRSRPARLQAHDSVTGSAFMVEPDLSFARSSGSRNAGEKIVSSL